MKHFRGNQINWNQVFYFSQIALHGSIKEAATTLELSPPTLSEHLSQLERDLEVKLFDRRHRKLVLTPEGSRLFQHAKQMFEVGQRLIDVVSPIPLGCYPISIGIAPCPSSYLAHRLMGEYLSKFAPVNMKLVRSQQEDLEAGLVRAKYDFGFSNRIPQRKDICFELIHSSNVGFYIAKNFEDRDLGSLVKKLPVLVSDTEAGILALVEYVLNQFGLTPSSVISSDFPAFVLETCEKGRGIAVFSEDSVRKFDQIRPVKIPQKAPKLVDRLYVFWTKEAENSEAVKRLKELLPKWKQSFDKHHGGWKWNQKMEASIDP
ncbi:MAG: LysR family transcriptional regulator [Deltaproteobacteria bacterium]|nr:LysR family transcriptional regulator [Deltaproteobacteria bacterium]